MEALFFQVECRTLASRLASFNLDLESTLRKAIDLWGNLGQGGEHHRLFYGEFYLRDFLDKTGGWDFDRRLSYLRSLQRPVLL